MQLKHIFIIVNVQPGANYICGGADETIDHLVSCCPVLVQREYKLRHDRVASHVRIHWMLTKQAGFPVMDVLVETFSLMSL